VELLAEVVRSGVVESVHAGSLVARDADGSRVLSIGDPDAAVFPRSCNKPLQAIAMIELGVVERFGLEPRHVAVGAASHNGEQMHLDVVRDLLARADVPESALGCPHDLPLHEESRRAVLARGLESARIMHNCSGKHALKLATCAAQGWPLSGYLEPTHPLQEHLHARVAALVGEEIAAVGVDGCGAPLFGLSLTGLAGAFAALAAAGADDPGSPSGVVASAMRAHPELVGGTGRDVSALLRAVPGLVAKDGAEACYAAGLPDGRCVAFKVADGGARARPPVLIAALRALGVVVSGDEVAPFVAPAVLGGGIPVGEVRAAF
jgi:L-asparaginase II